MHWRPSPGSHWVQAALGLCRYLQRCSFLLAPNPHADAWGPTRNPDSHNTDQNSSVSFPHLWGPAPGPQAPRREVMGFHSAPASPIASGDTVPRPSRGCRDQQHRISQNSTGSAEATRGPRDSWLTTRLTSCCSQQLSEGVLPNQDSETRPVPI